MSGASGTGTARGARPLPEPDDSSAPFWDGCARGELLMQACSACGRVRFPPRPMCPACQSFQHEWTRASGRGRVWSWVVAHPPLLPFFAGRAPYPVAVVELDEGVRMVGGLVGCRPDEIAPGMRVGVEFEDAGEGVRLPQWRPA